MTGHTTTIRVRYEETDRMGVVYYGNYFTWFEIARTELFRALGISYRRMEENDRIRLMVVDARCRYKAPATYDDLVEIKTTITEIKNTCMTFAYKIFRDSKEIATGETSHVFTDDSKKPVKIPQKIRAVLNRFSIAGS